ncbi:MAG: patatin-like protein [Sphingomonadaceae bacterium]
MREKELRFALICYGGVSLAIYMHGVTKEIWRLARASRSFHDGDDPADPTETAYHRLLALIESHSGTRLRILPDIIAGASAGGINGVFLAQAISTGQSLEPLTALWLDTADVDHLLDPDARPFSAFTKFWATPIAWRLAGKRGGTIDKTVAPEARAEVRRKLSRLVRARWFAPPFGGSGFTAMLLSAFDTMAAGDVTARLLPADQPLDLHVTVTDFAGYQQSLRLNTPSEIQETEHRRIFSFRDDDRRALGDPIELTLAARSTASFPGAFPPFRVDELDGVLKVRNRKWVGRDVFLRQAFAGHMSLESAEQALLIDGSVLANAPFTPALNSLRDRPARREIDRRFVYIDPMPTGRTIGLTRANGGDHPGFFSTVFAALSDIPREQPIRDSLEAIDDRSRRIIRMQQIIEALRPGVDAAIEGLFGLTFFLDSPTPERIATWRKKAQSRAAIEAGFTFEAYGHIKLAGIVEDIASLVARQNASFNGEAYEALRESLWSDVRARGVDQVAARSGKGASAPTIAFFRAHDLSFRIRRLRFVIRTIATLVDSGRLSQSASDPLRQSLFLILSEYLDREAVSFYQSLTPDTASALFDDLALQRDLPGLDAKTDAALAAALTLSPKAERRVVLFAYLGFPFFDISTLPMLQGEGLDEFNPIKVDRISPEDARSIRSGTAATLKGIQFNSFGAFFSRAYRENDYLWGRLHGADRLFDIVLSSAPSPRSLPAITVAALKRDMFTAILDQEQARLTKIPTLFDTLRREIAASANAA